MTQVCANKEYKVLDVLLYILLIVVNLGTHETSWGLIVSIPQILFVLTLIALNKTEKAFFYHLIFTITCLAIPFSQITNPGESQYGLFNYSKLKIIGPLAYYHVITFIIFFLMIKRKIGIDRGSLFYSLIKIFVFLGGIGIFFGIIGVLFFEYYPHHFIAYSVYIIVIVVHAILLAKFYSQEFLQKIFQSIVAVLIAAPIASVILKFFGVTTFYGTTVIPVSNEVVYYSVFLIFTIFQFRKFVLPLISVFISLFILIEGGLGGKGVVIYAIAFIGFLISPFTPYYNKYYRKRSQIVKGFLYPSLLLFVIQIQSFFSNPDNKLFMYKFESFILMFKVFSGLEYIDLIPASPRVRIISLLNVLYDQIRNPIKLLFGSGYGSYFYDHYGLFQGMDLKTGFRQQEILMGKFGRPHDTLVAVPLANGFLGLFFILKLVYQYIMRIKYNFLAFAVVPWLLLTFYFNSQFGIVGLLMLYASQKNLGTSNKNDVNEIQQV